MTSAGRLVALAVLAATMLGPSPAVPSSTAKLRQQQRRVLRDDLLFRDRGDRNRQPFSSPFQVGPQSRPVPPSGPGSVTVPNQ